MSWTQNFERTTLVARHEVGESLRLSSRAVHLWVSLFQISLELPGLRTV
jgi:hypothetical protein